MTSEGERAAELLDAQARAEQLFALVSDRDTIRAGVRDSEPSDAIRALPPEHFGVTRHWHKRIIHSGPNTVATYHEDPPDRTIDADDIVFADYGRTWVLGDDPDKLRL